MLKSKTIERICCLALVIMLALTGAVWAGKARAGRKALVEVGYEKLFDQSTVHVIDIEMAQWDSFIASATSEEYAECSVTIDGEKLSNVAIRGKGNTSLSSVSGMGSQKYSFKIEFDHFTKGKSYRGLDKLSLNNLIYDATLMKDYLAYTLMYKMGVPSPLCSFVQINVNGEPWGLYLAVEGVEDSFLERNNMTTGDLYKPDSMSFGGGRGNGRDFDFEQFRVDEDQEGDTSETPESGAQQNDGFGASPGGSTSTDANANGSRGGSAGGQANAGENSTDGGASFGGQAGDFQMPENGAEGNGNFSMPNFGGGMFNFGMGNSDVKLQYIDDDPDSYSNIFGNAKTDVSKKDKARLVEALRKLNAQEDIENTVFTDEVITYLAVHSFLCNGDSYTGSMVHNYYLYEEDGQLAIIPWDYNLGFGGFTGGFNGTSTINSPIDSPVDNGNVSDRPLVSWIFASEESIARYHAVYDQFVTEVIESGWLADEIARVSALIRPYMEADESAFFSVEEFDTAIETLQSYCALRGESIRGQLNGDIPSTTAGQRNSSALVDASSLNLSAMGSMNTGGRRNASDGSGNDNEGPSGGGPSGGSSGSAQRDQDSGDSFGGSAGNRGNEGDQASPQPADPQGTSDSTDAAPAGNGPAEPESDPAKETESEPKKQTESVSEAQPGTSFGGPADSNRPAQEQNGQNRPFDFAGPNGTQNPGITAEQLWIAGLCVLALAMAIFMTFRIKGHNI